MTEVDGEAFKAAVIAGYAPSKDRREDIIRAAIVAYEAAKPCDPLRYAAPELLAALKECVLQIEYLHEKFTETGSGNGVLQRVQYIIAKAEGTT